MNVSYQKIMSGTLNNYPTSIINLSREGWSIIDVTGDGIKDIVMTNAGEPTQAVSPDDPPITILRGESDFTFEAMDTSALNPTGWINDYTFLDSDRDGLLEIVAVDHGRELAYDPVYWSKLWVYEYDPIAQSFTDRTSITSGNEIAFHHNASGSADVNLDGIADFMVAEMGPSNLGIYFGDRTSIFRQTTESVLGGSFSDVTTWGSKNYVNLGAAGAIDLKTDGDYDFVGLPYTGGNGIDTQDFGVAIEFENGSVASRSLFNVRDLGDTEIPDSWGFSYFRVEDLNNDGKQDILGFMENPENNAGGTAIFVSMLQNSAGGFDVSKALFLKDKALNCS